MITCTKRFGEYPAAHRQPDHDGHCALIHGHNWSFEITFGAKERDINGFVVDFGKLGFVKDFLAEHFDHTMLVRTNDPKREVFEQMAKDNLLWLYVMPDVSCEGLAEWVWQEVSKLVSSHTSGRVLVVKVVCFEDLKNSATYVNPFTQMIYGNP